MEKEILDKLSKIVQDLPSLPAVVQEVLAQLSNPSTQPEDLQKTLGRDPALSVKVLRIANSAYYCRGREIGSLADAIVLLGFKSIRSLVLTSAVQGVLSSGGGSAANLWEHCYSVAVACREVAREAGDGPAAREEAFLSGLFHDIGKGAIAQRFPGIYGKPLSCEGEREALAFHHGQLGQVLLTKWEIPETLCHAVGAHHDAEPEGLAAYVVVGNWLCEPIAPGIFPGNRAEPSALIARFGLDDYTVGEIRESIVRTMAEERGGNGV
jgi:putative nucleotidyltransferase with HDIG domain